MAQTRVASRSDTRAGDGGASCTVRDLITRGAVFSRLARVARSEFTCYRWGNGVCRVRGNTRVARAVVVSLWLTASVFEILLVHAAAYAQVSAEPMGLNLVLPRRATTCVSQENVLERLAQAAGTPPFTVDGAPPSSVSITVSRARQTFAFSVSLRHGEQVVAEREVHDLTCENLESSIVLVTSLLVREAATAPVAVSSGVAAAASTGVATTVDAQTSARTAEPAGESGEGQGVVHPIPAVEGSEGTGDVDPTESAQHAAPFVRAETPRERAHDVAVPATRPLGWALSLGAVVSAGVLSRTSLGVRLSGELRPWERFGFAFDAVYLPPVTQTVTDGHATWTAAWFGARGCVPFHVSSTAELAPCLGADAGFIHAAGHFSEASHAFDQWLLDVHVRGQLRVELAPNWGLVLGFDTALPLIRHRYEFTNVDAGVQSLSRTGDVLLAGDVSLEVSFF